MRKNAQNIEKKAEKTLKNACFSLKNGWYYVAYSGGIGWHTSTPDGYTKVQNKSTNVLLFIELSVTGIDRGLCFLIRKREQIDPHFPQFYTREVFFLAGVLSVAFLTGIRYHEKTKKYRGMRCAVQALPFGVPPPLRNRRRCHTIPPGIYAVQPVLLVPVVPVEVIGLNAKPSQYLRKLSAILRLLCSVCFRPVCACAILSRCCCGISLRHCLFAIL